MEQHNNILSINPENFVKIGPVHDEITFFSWKSLKKKKKHQQNMMPDGHT